MLPQLEIARPVPGTAQTASGNAVAIGEVLKNGDTCDSKQSSQQAEVLTCLQEVLRIVRGLAACSASPLTRPKDDDTVIACPVPRPLSIHLPPSMACTSCFAGAARTAAVDKRKHRRLQGLPRLAAPLLGTSVSSSRGMTHASSETSWRALQKDAVVAKAPNTNQSDGVAVAAEPMQSTCSKSCLVKLDSSSWDGGEFYERARAVTVAEHSVDSRDCCTMSSNVTKSVELEMPRSFPAVPELVSVSVKPNHSSV